MQVPFIDLRKIYLLQKQSIDLAIGAAINSGNYIAGRFCSEFENQMLQSVGKSGLGDVVGCNSGTDALVLSLIASGIQPGDQVVTVSHTAIPTITAIREVGAVPVFVDIDPETWVFDTDNLEAALSPKTKAVIAVHLYGNMVEMSELKRVIKKLKREDVAIIEDVAQAQGASLFAGQAGTLGRFGSYSFYPTKNLSAMGDGGAVFCSSPEDGAKVRMLRFYGQQDRAIARVSRGINSRLDEIQAAILSVRLTSLQQLNRRRAELMEIYRTYLSHLPIRFQQVTAGCQPAWHLCVIALEDSFTRDRLMKYLLKKNIETLIHYPNPTHLQSVLTLGSTASLPITEGLSQTILSLPMHSALSSEEQNYVIENVNLFYEGS